MEKRATLAVPVLFTSSSSDGGDEDKNDDFRLEEGIVIESRAMRDGEEPRCRFFRRRSRDAKWMQKSSARANEAMEARMVEIPQRDKTVRARRVSIRVLLMRRGGKERSAIFLCVMKTM